VLLVGGTSLEKVAHRHAVLLDVDQAKLRRALSKFDFQIRVDTERAGL
jgi:hypothetical protein